MPLARGSCAQKECQIYVYHLHSRYMLLAYLNLICYIYWSPDRQCWSLPIRSQNFMPALILNTTFIKRESKICYSFDSNWDPPDLEPAVITTDWKPADWEYPYWEQFN